MIYPSHLLVPDIFADDTTIGTSSHSIETLVETLTTDLQNVFLSRRNRILYNSYSLPPLDFCCIIWGNCSSTLGDKLVNFQKRAARVILDCDLYTSSSELFNF